MHRIFGTIFRIGSKYILLFFLLLFFIFIFFVVNYYHKHHTTNKHINIIHAHGSGLQLDLIKIINVFDLVKS